MDATKIPKMRSTERNTDGRPLNLPGIYKHRDSGAIFITAEGDEGIAQADAISTDRWRDAWERVGDVPTRIELLAMRKAQLVKDMKAEAIEKAKDEAELKAALGEVETKPSEPTDPKAK